MSNKHDADDMPIDDHMLERTMPKKPTAQEDADDDGPPLDVRQLNRAMPNKGPKAHEPKENNDESA